MNFSEAVLIAMEASKLKRADLARATGYSYQYISDLLAGKRRWHEVVINKVCAALGIEITFSCQSETEQEPMSQS
ncbi:helix-turn-helix domain-containing protein [Paenibacillus pinihumi]|uniref:helix-turn-helix domain-containing protein n=1 Tax=Paenibacillus pinihumi TaxID=669462 RepID=UPI00048F4A82|nr:helix-turn-helix transcriptional regulator [Paenibacillus pinihumi]